MMSKNIAQSPTLDVSESSFDNKGQEKAIDYLQRIDERVNSKIAKGMKKAIHLIVGKFDDMYQEKMKLFVKDEISCQMLDIRKELAEIKDILRQEKSYRECLTSKNSFNTTNVTQSMQAQSMQEYKLSKCPSRYINSPPDIQRSQDMGKSENRATEHLRKSQKNLHFDDLPKMRKSPEKLNIKSPEKLNEFNRESDPQRDKKLNKILKKAGADDLNEVIIIKQSPAKPNVRKTSPKKPSPKKVSEKKQSPKKISPRKVSPRKASPQKASPRKLSSKKASPIALKRITPNKASPQKVSTHKGTPTKHSSQKPSPSKPTDQRNYLKDMLRKHSQSMVSPQKEQPKTRQTIQDKPFKCQLKKQQQTNNSRSNKTNKSNKSKDIDKTGLIKSFSSKVLQKKASSPTLGHKAKAKAKTKKQEDQQRQKLSQTIVKSQEIEKNKEIDNTVNETQQSVIDESLEIPKNLMFKDNQSSIIDATAAGKNKANAKIEKQASTQVNKYLELMNTNSVEGQNVNVEIERTVNQSQSYLDHSMECSINVSNVHVNLNETKEVPKKEAKAEEANKLLETIKTVKTEDSEPLKQLRPITVKESLNESGSSESPKNPDTKKASMRGAESHKSQQETGNRKSRIPSFDKKRSFHEKRSDSKKKEKAAEEKPKWNNNSHVSKSIIYKTSENEYGFDRFQVDSNSMLERQRGDNSKKSRNRIDKSVSGPHRLPIGPQGCHGKRSESQCDIPRTKHSRQQSLNDAKKILSPTSRQRSIQEVVIDQSAERRFDEPMNIIIETTDPLRPLENQQEFTAPIILESQTEVTHEDEQMQSEDVNSLENQILEIPKTNDTAPFIVAKETGSQDDKQELTAERLQKMVNDEILKMDSDSAEQFILATNQLSIFMNRKSIDLTGTPESRAIDEEKQADSRESDMKTQTPLPEFNLKSQEITQEFQKDPLYLLTLSGKNKDLESTPTIYLTTTKDINRDPNRLMEGLSKFIGKQPNEYLEKFVFKILAGANTDSPSKVQEKIRELSQNIKSMNEHQRQTISQQVFTIEDQNTSKEESLSPKASDEVNRQSPVNDAQEQNDGIAPPTLEDQEVVEGSEVHRLEPIAPSIPKNSHCITPEESATRLRDEEVLVLPEQNEVFMPPPLKCSSFSNLPPQASQASQKSQHDSQHNSQHNSRHVRRPSNFTNQQRSSNMGQSNICTEFDMNYSNDDSDELKQDRDSAPAPINAPPLPHTLVDHDNFQDLFLKKMSDSQEAMPKEIHHNRGNTDLTCLTRFTTKASGLDLTQKISDQKSQLNTNKDPLLEDDSSKEVSQQDITEVPPNFLGHKRDVSDNVGAEKLQPVIEDDNVQRLMHKRNATQQPPITNSSGPGPSCGPKNTMDMMTSNIPNPGQEILEIITTQSPEKCQVPPMESPPIRSPLEKIRQANNAQKSSHSRNSSVTKRQPPVHNFRPAAKQITSQDNTGYADVEIGQPMTCLPAQLAKVCNAVNKAQNIVRETGTSRSRSNRRRDNTQDKTVTNNVKNGSSHRQGSVAKPKHLEPTTSQKVVQQAVKRRGDSNRRAKQTAQQKNYGHLLSSVEQEKFGDRCPAGFKKLGLLGKGGAAIVWMAEVTNTKKYSGYSVVALKQFPKKGKTIDHNAKNEAEICNILFPIAPKVGVNNKNSVEQRRKPSDHGKDFPGMNSIAQYIDQIEDKSDVWLVFEVGPVCLRKSLFDLKGEFFKGERIHKVQHMQFYKRLLNNKQVLRSFIIKLAETLDVLQHFGIIHSDLKPDNILMEVNSSTNQVSKLKIIDFGTSFKYTKATQLATTTPEYLPPEILKHADDKNSPQKISNLLTQSCKPWSYDVWSLGIILLEIVTGCPVWMHLKSRVATADGKSLMCQGLFGNEKRDVKKIMSKQQQVLKSIDQTLKKFECYGLDQDPHFLDLLQRVLAEDPAQRLSPRQIIQHKFCQATD